MRKIHDSPDGRRLTVEDLLRVKRLEKPSPEFWSAFERELQEKQLKALVKRGWRERIWAVVAPKLTVLAPVSAVAGIAAVVFVSSWIGWTGSGDAVDSEALAGIGGESELEAVAGDSVEMVSAERPRRVDSRFVVDALVPEREAGQSFRTVSAPETFTALNDGAAHYVMNVFTAGGEAADLVERGTEF